jgi:hypothetical protein
MGFGYIGENAKSLGKNLRLKGFLLVVLGAETSKSQW